MAKAAVWSVPVIALGAAVPSFAASASAEVNVYGSCTGTSPNASFTVAVPVLPNGARIRIALAKSTSFGSFTASLPGYSHSGSGTAQNPYVYVITGTGAAFQGLITVTFDLPHLPQNPPMTITADAAGLDGLTLTGVTTASVTKHRDGNGGNYPCG